MTEPIITVDNCTKSFGGLMAVKSASLELAPGTITGLIGPNGAGKTTLLNLIAGVYPADKGEIRFRGKSIGKLKPFQRAHLGISRTFQIPQPFEGMSVAENVRTAAYFGSDKHHHSHAGSLKERTDQLLQQLNLYRQSRKPVGELNLVQRKRLEVARALATEPEVLLLDEVMGGLNFSEIESMMTFIRVLRDQGITIIVVEHIMKAIMSVSDTIVVLHHGEKIAEGTPQAVANDEAVIKAYLGERYAKSSARSGGDLRPVGGQ